MSVRGGVAKTPGVGYRGKEIGEIWDDELNDQGMLVQVRCIQTLHPVHTHVLGFTSVSSVSNIIVGIVSLARVFIVLSSRLVNISVPASSFPRHFKPRIHSGEYNEPRTIDN